MKKTRGIATIFLPHFGALAALADLGASELDDETDDPGEPYDDGALTDRIVVHDGHRITSASWALLEQGLMIGDTIRRTRALFPRAHIAEQEPMREEIHWDQVLRLCYEITPQIEPVINNRYLGRWLHLQGCSRRDLQSLLERLQAPGGYAASRDLSMIAATLAPPGALHVLRPAEEEAVLRQVPTAHLALFGFHPDCIHLLTDIGRAHLAEVRTLTKRQLQAQFQDEGLRLHALLHPDDRLKRPVPYWDPLTVTAHVAIEWPIATQQQLQQALEVIARKALSETPDCARSVSAGATYRRAQHTAMRHLKVPTRALTTLVDLALDLCQTSPHPPDELIALSLALGRLTPNTAVQTDFFHKPAVEHLALAMSHRFPGKLCRPIAAQRAFLPERLYRLSPVLETR